MRTIADGTTIQARVVDIAADFPLRLVEPSGDISFELTERSGIDWFDLDLGVMLDGQRISLVPALLDFIANTGMDAVASLGVETDDHALPMLLPLPDGRLLTIPLAQLRPILAPLLELFTGAEIDGETGTLRLSRRNAGDLALLEAASAEGGIVLGPAATLSALWAGNCANTAAFRPAPYPAASGRYLRVLPGARAFTACEPILVMTSPAWMPAEDAGLSFCTSCQRPCGEPRPVSHLAAPISIVTSPLCHVEECKAEQHIDADQQHAPRTTSSRRRRRSRSR